MKKKNGFISVSIVYTFFIVFLLLLILVITSYMNNRITLGIYKQDIKEYLVTPKSKECTGKFASQCVKYLKDDVLVDEIETDVHEGYKNYRYIGANPDNYVCFEDETNLGSCINYTKGQENVPAGLFRIIGLFNQDTHGKEGEELIKLISADDLGNESLSWDHKVGIGSSTYWCGSNDWSDSQIMYMLNGFVNTGYNGNMLLHTEYIYKGYEILEHFSWEYEDDWEEWDMPMFKLYNGLSYLTGNGSTTLYIPDEFRYDKTTGHIVNKQMQTLKTSQAKMIEEVTWYLGSLSTTISLTPTFYDYERDTNTCYSKGNCSMESPTKWTGKIGLMYPSDYGYATSGGTTYNRDKCLSDYTLNTWYNYEDCYKNNWLLYIDSRTDNNGTKAIQPSISPDDNHTCNIIFVDSSGRLGSNVTSNPYFYTRPSFYLKSDVYISGGTGTSDDPYLLKMD